MSILQPIARRSNVKKSFVGCRSAPIRRAGPQYNVGVSGRPAHTPLPLYYYIGQTVWESHFANSYWVNLFGTRWPRVPLESHSSPTRVEFPSSYWVNPFRAKIFRVPFESHSSPTRVPFCGSYWVNLFGTRWYRSSSDPPGGRKALRAAASFLFLSFPFSFFFSPFFFPFLFFLSFSFLFLFPLSLLFSSRASSQNTFLFQGGCKLVLLERYFFSSKCLLFPSF